MKHLNAIYEIIVNANENGISTKDVAKELNMKSHNIKNQTLQLKTSGKIFSRISLERKTNGNPDARNIKLCATIYKTHMALNADQLRIINKIRIGRKISEVGK